MRIKAKDERLIQKRTFQCNECGTKVVYTKRKEKTAKGHIKTAYCYMCRKITDHTQID